MRIAEKDLREIDWAKVEARRIEEGLSKEDISEMLGKTKGYYSKAMSCNHRIHKDTAKALTEILDLDAPAKPVAEAKADARVLDYLITEIGMLKGEIEALKKKVEEPQIVAIPMHPKEMATRTLASLLEGGWCTKDAVLNAFNEKHIPLDYLSDAVRANGAIGATSGVADHARTFYIKEENI